MLGIPKERLSVIMSKVSEELIASNGVVDFEGLEKLLNEECQQLTPGAEEPKRFFTIFNKTLPSPVPYKTNWSTMFMNNTFYFTSDEDRREVLFFFRDVLIAARDIKEQHHAKNSQTNSSSI